MENLIFTTIISISFIWYILYNIILRKYKDKLNSLITNNEILKVQIEESTKKNNLISEQLKLQIDSYSKIQIELHEVKEKSIRAFEDGRVSGKSETEKDYKIEVYPYLNQEEKVSKVLGIFNKSKLLIEQGVQYQLFIKGIPVFETVKIIRETKMIQNSEINKDKLIEFAKEAIEIANSFTPQGQAMMQVKNVLPEKLIGKLSSLIQKD